MDISSNFQYIWNEWVCPLVEDLYAQMDEDFKKQCSVEIRDLAKISFEAEKFYQKKREEVKRAFYGEYNKGDSESEHRMDFHKIGAIVCKTLIDYKVFNFDVEQCEKYIEEKISPYNTDWVVKNALINFRVAFYASIVFLFHSIRFVYYKENPDIYERLSKIDSLDLYNHSFSVETTDLVKESFENCVVLDLAKRDIGNHSFDYLMYAVILYQLEEYNIMKLLQND